MICPSVNSISKILHISHGKEPSQLLFPSLKWIRMVLFYLSTIWGLGYIHFIQGSTRKGMILVHILILYVTKKLKERPGQWRNARCAPLSTKLRAPEHLGREGVPQVIWQKQRVFGWKGMKGHVSAFTTLLR